MKEDSIDKLLKTWHQERPDLDPWPSGIAARIFRLSVYLRRRAETWLIPMGLSWETFEIIVALRRSGFPYEMKPTALYKETFLTSGAMTNRLDRAQQAGLIARRADPDDRRGVLVSLTQQGVELADRGIWQYYEENSGSMGHLAPKQRMELTNHLRSLLMVFESEADSQENEDQSEGKKNFAQNGTVRKRAKKATTSR